jgi:hypothetical protein
MKNVIIENKTGDPTAMSKPNEERAPLIVAGTTYMIGMDFAKMPKPVQKLLCK